jgi:invasion protein IalB
MSNSSLRIAAVVGAMTVGLLPAVAQQNALPPQAAPQGPLRVNLLPSETPWKKTCGNEQFTGKRICYTARDFKSQADKPPVMTAAIYAEPGKDGALVRFLLPVGLKMRPGFRIAIDKGVASKGDYDICFPNGCFAEVSVKKDVVDAARTGATMAVSVMNQANVEVVFILPLTGFAPAFDGQGVEGK